MNHRTLFFILFILIMQPVSAIGQSLERQPEYQPSSDCITIDGRTYKLSPEFRIPSGIDIDSPVKLNFDDDTHELLSIERLVEDYSTENSLEYHFGIVNAISKPGIDLSYSRNRIREKGASVQGYFCPAPYKHGSQGDQRKSADSRKYAGDGSDD